MKYSPTVAMIVGMMQSGRELRWHSAAYASQTGRGGIALTIVGQYKCGSYAVPPQAQRHLTAAMMRHSLAMTDREYVQVDRGIKKRAHDHVFGSIGAKTSANGGQK